MKFSTYRLRKSVLPVLALVLLALVPGPGFAQTSSPTREQLPSATQVLERFTAALGGKEAILKHDSISRRGKLELPVFGRRFEYLEMIEPGRKLVKISTGEGKLVAQDGIFGDVHWHLDANGSTILSTDNPGSLHRDSDPFSDGGTTRQAKEP